MNLFDKISSFFVGSKADIQKAEEPSSGKVFNNVTTYQDKNNIPVGSVLDKSAVSSILQLAHNGDTRKLHALYEEMTTDSHIAAEYTKIKAFLTQSPFELNAYPPSVMKLENKDSEEYARAMEIKNYVEDQLTDPDVKLQEAIGHLLWGLMTSVSGLEPIVQPKGYQGTKEKLLALNAIPSTRYRYPNLDSNLCIQLQDDANLLTPVNELGDQIVTIQSDVHIASPARRGVFRKLISPWIIRRYAVEWWSRNVELHGIGTRVAKYPSANEEQKVLLEQTLSTAGSASYIVIPDGIDFDIKSPNTGTATPHSDILVWASREISKNLTGSTQTSEIQSGEGSKASSGTHLEMVIKFAEAYAVSICICLREQLIKPMVARNFSPEDAELYCPTPSIRIKGYEDLLTIATALNTFQDAGFTAIPLSWVYASTGIPQPEEGEDTLASLIPSPKGIPVAPVAPSEASVSLSESFASRINQLPALEDRAKAKFLRATTKLTEPYRKAIEQTEREGGSLANLANRVTFLARHDGKTLEETTDIVNSILLEALLQGIKDASK